MSDSLSRRKFLSIAGAGSVLALGGIHVAETAQTQKLAAGTKTGGKMKANEARPLLFGAGMFWAKWREKPWDYDHKQMKLLKELGGKITSASFDWCELEKEKGKFNWDYTDHVVDAAQDLGLKQFGYVGNTAPWALPPGIKPEHGYRNPPRDDCEKDFRNYCTKVAARYKGQVELFQFWNEPNGCSWINDGCSNGHMFESYTKWLKIAYEALKEGNPKCVVCAAALDYNEGVKEGYKYIEGMYQCGAKGYFDAISIHPYADSGLHWKAVEDTRRVMVENGDGSKGIWITEWGYHNSKTPDAARKLKEVLTKLLSPEYSYVRIANYLVITDLPDGGYGLYDSEMVENRPIAAAFKEMANMTI
ncbi:MAG: beta-galactosidase [Armatimonadota bacterium]